MLGDSTCVNNHEWHSHYDADQKKRVKVLGPSPHGNSTKPTDCAYCLADRAKQEAEEDRHQTYRRNGGTGRETAR